MSTTKRKLAFASVAVVGGLLLVEGAARAVEAFRPPREVDVGAGFLEGSRVFVPVADRPGLLRTAPAKSIAFLPQEFAERKPPRTFRVAAVGGSSIRKLEPEFRVLRERLVAAYEPRYDQVEVINAGAYSYGSARLVLVTKEVLGYEPDVVVLYEANNEFEEMQQLRLASLETAPVQLTASRFAAVRVVRDLFVEHESERLMDEERVRQSQIAARDPDIGETWAYQFSPEDAAQRMREFHENMAAIVAACRAKGVPVVIGTVPSNLVRPRLSGDAARRYMAVGRLLDARKYDEAASLGRRLLASLTARHQSSDVENGIIRALAKEMSIPLADVETAVVAAEPHHVPGETLFADYCHLTPAGNVILRETLEKTILEVAPPPKPGAPRSVR